LGVFILVFLSVFLAAPGEINKKGGDF